MPKQSLKRGLKGAKPLQEIYSPSPFQGEGDTGDEVN